MTKVLATIVLALVATIASAQSRDTWISKCQAEDPELANSNGYRVCTELYVVELEKRQEALVAGVVSMLDRARGDGAEPALAREHFVRSQALWRSYVEEHCQMAQAMFGPDSPSGDAIPSCSAVEFEARNAQLERLLQGEQER